MAFTDDTARGLDAIAFAKQAEGRVPGLAAGVARQGELEWFAGVGSAHLDRPGEAPDPDTQYPVASNTKTFTAVCVMQLRDEGKLSLDDRLDAHLPVTSNGDITVRQALSHTSGMQREPDGDVWDTLAFPGRDELLDNWDRAERVLKPHFKWHYSNLCYAMLGELIARLDGREWMESVQARLLDPLGMRRTTLGPSDRLAGAYYLSPFTDVPVVEPGLDCLAVAPAGGLCSTAEDLATWGGFFADPGDLLSADTLLEMMQVQLVIESPAWTHGWGLGLHVMHLDGRTWVGHTGGWPGSITGLYTHRDSGTSAMVLMNNTSAVDPAAAAIGLGAYAVEHAPPAPQAWVPGTETPDEIVDLLGVWYSEGYPFVFSVRQGELEAKAQGVPASTPASRFVRLEEDVYRTVAGRERGELLRITRDSAGRPVKMHWATYLCTRAPLSFGEELRLD